MKQLQEERSIKHLNILSLKDGQQFQIVYNAESNHYTLWITAFVVAFDIFQLYVSVLGKQPADCKWTFGTIWQLHEN